MINLSTADGLFERVESWETILELPNFFTNVEADAAQLQSIIGNYAFDNPVNCGLAACRQPHGKGYLVQLKDGRKTNLGKDCGKKYFGTDFELASKRFDRARRDQENRLELTALQSQIPRLRQRVVDLRQGTNGADWAHRALQKLLVRNDGVPDAVITELGKRLRARDPRVMRERIATEEEVQQLEAAAGGERRIRRPHYIEEPVGALEGFQSLYQENDLRTLLVTGISLDLDEVDGRDISTMISKDLAALSKKTSDIEARFKRAEDALVEARKLLRQSNLKIFEVRLSEPRDRQKFREFLNVLPN